MMLLLVGALVSPVVGWLLDRIEAQLVMIFGAILVAAGFIIASRAQAFGTMALAFLIVGIGLAFSTIVPSQVVVVHWFEERLRALAFLIVIGSGMASGGIVIVPATAAIVQAWGWRMAFLAIAAAVVIVVLPLFVLVVRGRGVKPGHAEKQSDLPGLSITEGFSRVSLWLIMLSYLSYGFAQGLPLAHLIPWLVKLGYSPQFAAKNVAEYHVVTIFACLLMGFLGDRIGAKLPLVVCLIMLATSLVVVLGARETELRILFLICFGFGVAAPAGLLAKLLVQTTGSKSFGFFSGIGTFLLTLGWAASPLVGGWIVDVTGAYRDAFWLSAVLALVAGAAALGVSVPKRSGTEPVAFQLGYH
jgi:MFS family permease